MTGEEASERQPHPLPKTKSQRDGPPKRFQQIEGWPPAKGAFEGAVLITNDSDLLEPVKIVRHELKLPIGILNPHQHHSVDLKREATFIKRIRQADVAACQFPNPMTDAKGQFHKPSTW